MSALPPGYSRCPNDAGHIYPSYLAECNVCADLRARGGSVAPAMANLDTSEPAVDESVWPKLGLFAVIMGVVMIGVIGAVSRSGEFAESAGVKVPPVKQTLEQITAPPQPQPTPRPIVRATPPPSRSGFESINPVFKAVQPPTGLSAENPLPAPAPSRGAFTPMPSDLAGHWEIQQADVGGVVANIDISPVGDTYSILVQGGVKNKKANNMSVAMYDGSKLLITASWAMLGGTYFRMQRVGPELFEGNASFNGKRVYPVKMVRTFE